MTNIDKLDTLNRPACKLALVKKANLALEGALKSCSICPRQCGVNRRKGSRGYCRAGSKPVVYSYAPHYGEEPPLSGNNGSGTIFFSHCNMRCVYCQNYYFSQLDNGQEVSIDELTMMMLKLEARGCHNINLVTPTHFMPQILIALEHALERGLGIPIVYNTSGYESVDVIRLLDGIIDIYLPDMRYSDNSMALRYSGAPNYRDNNREAVKEMHRQVDNLILNEGGIAERGLIIRLLALPETISGTADSLRYIKDKIAVNSYISIMSQYHPVFKARDYKEMSHRITAAEYTNIVDEARNLGLNNGWIQGVSNGPDAGFLGTNITPNTEI